LKQNFLEQIAPIFTGVAIEPAHLVNESLILRNQIYEFLLLFVFHRFSGQLLSLIHPD